MELKLNLSGSAEPLINYLEGFSRIRESLLLEVDTKNRSFVSKQFGDGDYSSVRFASILFDDANLSIVSDDGEEERGAERIKLGILIQLKKFIKIVSSFGADKDENGKSNFEIVIKYDKTPTNGGNSLEYVATSTTFKSNILLMKMDGFRISEFRYVSDEVFANRLFNVQNPVSIVLTKQAIDTIVKTSDIIKVDPRRDTLIFYTEGNILKVKDLGYSKNAQPNFVYTIGEFETEPSMPISISISRDKFIKMVDKNEGDFRLTLGTESDGVTVMRILFESLSTTAKIVIAGLE